MASRKDARINLRTTREQDTLIRRAADAQGKSVSEFVLEAACRSARKRLARYEDNSARQARLEAVVRGARPGRSRSSRTGETLPRKSSPGIEPGQWNGFG